MPRGRKSNIASFSSPLFLFSLSPVQSCVEGAANFQGHEQISLSTAYTRSDRRCVRVVARNEKVSDGKSMATECDEHKAIGWRKEMSKKLLRRENSISNSSPPPPFFWIEGRFLEIGFSLLLIFYIFLFVLYLWEELYLLVILAIFSERKRKCIKY